MSLMTTKGRSCDGKRAFAKREATRVIARMCAQRAALPGMLRAYKCRHCGSWHVGHFGRGR